MSFDAVTRRYKIVIFGGLVAVAAYFQASGIGQLVAGHLVPDRAVKMKARSTEHGTTYGTKSGREILARNPFDSITGPLEGVAPAPSDAPSAVGAHKPPGGNPYQDAPCAGVRSSLVTATEDHAWSFASLSMSGEDKLRRIGDKLNQYTVQHIGYYESPDHDVVPRVWLMDGASRCIVEMGAGDPNAKPAPTEPPATRPKTPSKNQKLQNKIKDKIKKIGENSYEVDKSGVELIIQHYAKLAGSLRGRPTKDGMRLSGIKEESIMSELGMKNGDMLKTINGFDMSDPDKAVDAYAKLRRAGKLDLAVTRDGAPFTVNVAIK